MDFYDSFRSILICFGMLKFRFDKKVVRNEVEAAKASMVRQKPEKIVSTQVLFSLLQQLAELRGALRTKVDDDSN